MVNCSPDLPSDRFFELRRIFMLVALRLRRLLVVIAALALFGLSGGPGPARAQTDGLLPLNDPLHHFLERQRTAGHLPEAFVTSQPLSVYEARAYLDSLQTLDEERGVLSASARRHLAQFQGRTPFPGATWMREWTGALYENGRDFASVAGDGYGFQVNPLAYGTIGSGNRPAETGTTWQLTRGARVSGHIGDHLFFDSRLTENQEVPLRFRFEGTPNQGTAPRRGFVRLAGDDDVYDYLQATGMVGGRARFFEVRFGRSRNRWGPGIGSLQLSNHSPPYDQLQIRTSVWRLQYANLFARFTDFQTERFRGGERGGITNRPRRYGAFHRLGIRVADNLQVGLFESIIFATQEDSTVSRTGFDTAYLNPIIFYRAVERDLGSPDNAMIGADAEWVVTPGLRTYGQFVLDEFTFERIGTGWFGNKWGWMLGAHVTQTGLPGLGARLEVTRQRPFLNGNRFTPNAFLHYNDLLGHPAEPNSIDVALFLDYRPGSRIQAELNAAFTRRGRNPDGQNVGANPRLDADTRSSSYVDLLDGVQQDAFLVEGHVGYEVLPDLFVEAALQIRTVDDAVRGTERFWNPYVMVRWGLPFQSSRY